MDMDIDIDIECESTAPFRPPSLRYIHSHLSLSSASLLSLPPPPPPIQLPVSSSQPLLWNPPPIPPPLSRRLASSPTTSPPYRSKFSLSSPSLPSLLSASSSASALHTSPYLHVPPIPDVGIIPYTPEYRPSIRPPSRLHRHRSQTALHPVERLTRKLSEHSLRHHEPPLPTIRKRPTSVDLHRANSFRSSTALLDARRDGGGSGSGNGNGASLMRDAGKLLSHHQDASSPLVTSLTHCEPLLARDPISYASNPYTRRRSSYTYPQKICPVEHHPVVQIPLLDGQLEPITASQVTLHDCPILEVDEACREGEDDLSWLAASEDHDSVANSLRRRGLLQYRTSQDAAMQSSNLVRNLPRMRRRRMKKRESRILNGSVTGGSEAPSSPTSTIATIDSEPQSPGLMLPPPPREYMNE